MTRAGRKTDAATMLLMVLLILTAAKLLLERLLALMLPHDLHQNTRLLLSMAQEALLIGLPALLMRRGRSARTGTMRQSISLLLCAAVLGHIPQTGEKLRWNTFTFEIVDMDGARIDKILACETSEKTNQNP